MNNIVNICYYFDRRFYGQQTKLSSRKNEVTLLVNWGNSCWVLGMPRLCNRERDLDL